MDIDYNLEDSSLSGILANITAPAPSSSPPVEIFRSSTVPASIWSSTSSPPQVPSSTVGAIFGGDGVSSTVTAVTEKTTVLAEAGQRKLVDSLEEAAKIFREMAKPAPPVVIINQLPPAPPAPSWHQDPDLPAVGAAAGFIVFFLLVVGCLWLRRFHPPIWERVKVGLWRVCTWLALPLSWVCSRAADLLRHLHTAAEGQRGASANTVQVSKTEFSVDIRYRYDMYIHKYRYDIGLNAMYKAEISSEIFEIIVCHFHN